VDARALCLERTDELVRIPVDRRLADKLQEGAGFALGVAVDPGDGVVAGMQVRNLDTDGTQLRLEDVATLGHQAHGPVMEGQHTVDPLDAGPARRVIQHPIQHGDVHLELAAAIHEGEMGQIAFERQPHVVGTARNQTAFQPFIGFVGDSEGQVFIDGVSLAPTQMALNVHHRAALGRQQQIAFRIAFQIGVDQAGGLECNLHTGVVQVPVRVGIQFGEFQLVAENLGPVQHKAAA